MLFRKFNDLEMAEICCGVSESEKPEACGRNSRSARRRRMDIRRCRFAAGVGSEEIEASQKRSKLELYPTPFSLDCENAVTNSVANQSSSCPSLVHLGTSFGRPRYGATSVCGPRRDMEDEVAVHPSFCRKDLGGASELHYFGVYDGHGCSHVSTKCKERLHELVKEEIENTEEEPNWTIAMERSFFRMDGEVNEWSRSALNANCRCELQTPECDAVGSTAVVAVVTPEKIILANCGDSRAVLCRNGKAFPLSSDHKPDRPDELRRIEDAGGRVIYWDGPRVLGVLAMSRAIGDNYLKPYVTCEPEVTIMERSPDDECLILASDGLWDVVSNNTACGVARMCLQRCVHAPSQTKTVGGVVDGGKVDGACSDASMLLTKLALARRSTDNVSVLVVDLRGDGTE